MTILTFGKYEGQHLEDVPWAYKAWLSSQPKSSNLVWSSFVDRARELVQGHCLSCAGKLVPIGAARVNGAAHLDWEGRQYHKQCWKALRATR